MDIGERIKLLRKRLSLSQNDFGKRLGISRDSVNNIENNRLAKPEQKEPIYKLICKEFNVNEDWLRTGAGGDENMFISADAQRFLNIGRAARNPNEFRDFLSQVIQTLPDEFCDYLYEEFKRFEERKKKDS